MLYKVTTYSYDSIMAEGTYKKCYRPGSIVSTPKNTLGLMLFKTLDQARKFSSIYDCAIILEVEEMGELTVPTTIALFMTEEHLDYFYKCKSIPTTPPKGTVCCNAVKVKREITCCTK